MEGRVEFFAAYLRQSWPLFAAGLVVGFILGVLI